MQRESYVLSTNQRHDIADGRDTWQADYKKDSFTMPNLADNRQREQFVRRLEKCEAIPVTILSDWERGFLNDLRDKFESRDDAFDLGLTPWNPSANQWNTLTEISEKW